MSNKRGTLDSYELARESVERGAVLPDSAMAVMAGTTEYAGRHPTSTGYESERAIAVGGRVVIEADYFAEIAHPECAVCRELFVRGWNHALHGWEPSRFWYPRPSAFIPDRMIPPSASSLVELSGYNRYREVRGLNNEEE